MLKSIRMGKVVGTAFSILLFAFLLWFVIGNFMIGFNSNQDDDLTADVISDHAYLLLMEVQKNYLNYIAQGNEPKDFIYNFTDGKEIENSAQDKLNLLFIPKSGKVIQYADGDVVLAYYEGKWCATKNRESNNVIVTETTEEQCKLEKE